MQIIVFSVFQEIKMSSDAVPLMTRPGKKS